MDETTTSRTIGPLIGLANKKSIESWIRRAKLLHGLQRVGIDPETRADLFMIADVLAAKEHMPGKGKGRKVDRKGAAE